jgi:hypothetical protein
MHHLVHQVCGGSRMHIYGADACPLSGRADVALPANLPAHGCRRGILPTIRRTELTPSSIWGAWEDRTARTPPDVRIVAIRAKGLESSRTSSKSQYEHGPG